MEQPIQVRLDPRTTAGVEDIALQSELSMQCYSAYNTLQSFREDLDLRLNNPKRKWKQGEKEKLIALRGAGLPDGGDIIYSSITEVPLEQESIVSLQDKLLYMMGVLQSTDAKPTEQAGIAVGKLTKRFTELTVMYNGLKNK
jgi:hypothetical protein